MNSRSYGGLRGLRGELDVTDDSTPPLYLGGASRQPGHPVKWLSCFTVGCWVLGLDVLLTSCCCCHWR